MRPYATFTCFCRLPPKHQHLSCCSLYKFLHLGQAKCCSRPYPGPTNMTAGPTPTMSPIPTSFPGATTTTRNAISRVTIPEGLLTDFSRRSMVYVNALFSEYHSSSFPLLRGDTGIGPLTTPRHHCGIFRSFCTTYHYHRRTISSSLIIRCSLRLYISAPNRE